MSNKEKKEYLKILDNKENFYFLYHNFSGILYRENVELWHDFYYYPSTFEKKLRKTYNFYFGNRKYMPNTFEMKYITCIHSVLYDIITLYYSSFKLDFKFMFKNLLLFFIKECYTWTKFKK